MNTTSPKPKKPEGLTQPRIAVTSLTPSNILPYQPTLNIGTLGHVANGKTTLVKSLTGIDPIKSSKELKRNKMTINLGFANCKIWKCSKCPRPSCYSSSGSNILSQICKNCSTPLVCVRHVSFVDSPGHDMLMSTMLNGAAVMNSALLVLAGNVDRPQPQSREHLAAADLIQLKDMIVVQNKIDLTVPKQAQENYLALKKFLKGTICSEAPVVPLSAQFGINVDVVCELIAKMNVPKQDLESDPIMLVIRSFDVNKPGTHPRDVKGAVCGGSLLRGVLQVGMEVEMRPGIVRQVDGKVCYTPIKTVVKSLLSQENSLSVAVPGGLIGLQTDIDPSLSVGNRLVGQVIGQTGKMPPVFKILEVNYWLLRRIVGLDKNFKMQDVKIGEDLRVNIGAMTCNCTVIAATADLMKIDLKIPSCCNLREKISISRRIYSKWRLIGFGIIREGSVEADPI